MLIYQSTHTHKDTDFLKSLTVSASTVPLSVTTGSGKADFLVFRPTGGERAEARGAVDEAEVN